MKNRPQTDKMTNKGQSYIERKKNTLITFTNIYKHPPPTHETQGYTSNDICKVRTYEIIIHMYSKDVI